MPDASDSPIGDPTRIQTNGASSRTSALPFFVLFSMAADLHRERSAISDFALTPPIDAIKAIAGGTFEANVPNAI